MIRILREWACVHLYNIWFLELHLIPAFNMLLVTGIHIYIFIYNNNQKYCWLKKELKILLYLWSQLLKYILESIDYILTDTTLHINNGGDDCYTKHISLPLFILTSHISSTSPLQFCNDTLIRLAFQIGVGAGFMISTDILVGMSWLRSSKNFFIGSRIDYFISRFTFRFMFCFVFPKLPRLYQI